MISKRTEILCLLTALFLTFGCKSVAQKNLSRKDSLIDCPFEFDSLLQKQVYTKVDSMPEFKDGNIGILNYFKSNYKISNKIDDFQASFKFEFVIDNDGILIGERIKGKHKEKLSTSEIEALRVLSNMPKWKAGKCNGQAVPVKVILPLKL